MNEFFSGDSLLESAVVFTRQYYQEMNLQDLESRISEIEIEIRQSGSYTHTADEILFGAKLAWRNSNRCIGRLFYDSLELLDHRDLNDPDEIFSALVHYLDQASNGGRIKPTICVFKPKDIVKNEQIRIWNNKLIRYAGYVTADGIIGDPEEVAFTKQCEKMGWIGEGTPFDILPVVLEVPGLGPKWYSLPDEVCLQVPIEHPEYDWFAELGLRWYAVPVISNMILEIGGIHYTAAPFNGWFMSTEIGSRNLGDRSRYNMLPKVAEKMGLDIHNRALLWKDRAIIELNTAVIHSYQKMGVTLVDHHTASRQFMRFIEQENHENRDVNADWSWIVPPMSGSTMEVFYESWKNDVVTPNFFYRDPVWVDPVEDHKEDTQKQAPKCPFHISSINLK
jgi:nitric-oxide synthase, bacterial